MGLGAEIAAIVAERALDDLRAPVERLTMPDVAGIPASGPMEDYLIPDRARIGTALRALARVDRGQRGVVSVNGRESPPPPLGEGWGEGGIRPDASWTELVSEAAREIPQAASVVEVDLTNLTRRLDASRETWRRRGIEPSFTPFFAEALLQALHEVPHANAAFDAVGRGIRGYPAVHLAVSVTNAHGSAASHAVIRDADTRNVLGLAVEIDALRAADAGDPAVLVDGTVSLADFGPGSAMYAAPLVLPGQVAAVRVGAVDERVVARERGFALAPTAFLCASIDHRALDGMDAGALLGAMKRVLERE